MRRSHYLALQSNTFALRDSTFSDVEYCNQYKLSHAELYFLNLVGTNINILKAFIVYFQSLFKFSFSSVKPIIYLAWFTQFIVSLKYNVSVDATFSRILQKLTTAYVSKSSLMTIFLLMISKW